MIYVALGDSIATGYGNPAGYPELYKEILERNGTKVTLTNLGQNGWTSSDLLHAIKTNPEFKSHIAQADLITFNIGGNDFYNIIKDIRAQKYNNNIFLILKHIHHTFKLFQSNWNTITTEILNINKKPNLIIQTMNIYFPFVNEFKSQLIYRLMIFYTKKVNNFIQSHSHKHHIYLANIANIFNGAKITIDPDDQNIMADPIHPNTKGHQLIAQELKKLYK